MIEIKQIHAAIKEDGIVTFDAPTHADLAGRSCMFVQDHQGTWTIRIASDTLSLLQVQTELGLHNTFLTRAEISDLLERDYQFVDDEQPLIDGRWGTRIAGMDYEIVLSVRLDAEKLAERLRLDAR